MAIQEEQEELARSLTPEIMEKVVNSAAEKAAVVVRKEEEEAEEEAEPRPKTKEVEAEAAAQEVEKAGSVIINHDYYDHTHIHTQHTSRSSSS